MSDDYTPTTEPRRSVTGSLSFAFWRDRMGNIVERPDTDELTRRLKVVGAEESKHE